MKKCRTAIWVIIALTITSFNINGLPAYASESDLLFESDTDDIIYSGTDDIVNLPREDEDDTDEQVEDNADDPDLPEFVSGNVIRNVHRSNIRSRIIKLPIGIRVVSENSISGNSLSDNSLSGNSLSVNTVSINDMYFPEPLYKAEDYLDDYVYRPGAGEDRLLAKLIWHEADNQSYEGKVAVAELVMNRVFSDLFPNDIVDVIAQEKQFLYDEELMDCPVTDEYLEIARKVITGKERIFYNPYVFYYRNPVITSDIQQYELIDWDDYPWYGYIGEHTFYTQ